MLFRQKSKRTIFQSSIIILLIVVGLILDRNAIFNRHRIKNYNDANVISDLKTIDEDINKYFTDKYSDQYGDPLDLSYSVNGNINNMNIVGLNYPLSNYTVKNISYGGGAQGQLLTYDICTSFNTNTMSEGSFYSHPKGKYCFEVIDNDAEENNIIGYYPNQSPPNW